MSPPNSLNPLAGDLEECLEHTRDLWPALRGERLFITGGTGFFGCWLLESFTWANRRLNLGAQALVLSRNPAAFARKAPHLAAAPEIQFLAGDVRSFDFPPGQFAAVLHAATESSAQLNQDDPLRMLDTIVQGTRRALDFALACRAGAFLLTSSGAVYGRQPPGLENIPEEYGGAPDPLEPRSAYGQGKRLAEHLCALYARQHRLPIKIARCFAFVGPYLPLNVHFAAGNFIRDALAGGPIRIQGDGTPYRSYLYAGDLAAWLWTILLRGASARPYNAGSGQALSIAELAAAVAGQFQPAIPVEIARRPIPGAPAERYVPDVDRARDELGLEAWTPLETALEHTLEWNRQVQKSAGD